LERLEWIAPLSAGKGVTLSREHEANLLLAEDPNALLLGVLYDAQFLTVKAFAIPFHLKERLGHLNMGTIAEMDLENLKQVFVEYPALHRFPFKNAATTQKIAQLISERYGGDSGRIWREAANPDDLAARLMELPAFGIEKTNWTIGMLGRLGMLPFEGWEEYRVAKGNRKKA
jgi:uncharacterized HhH-GPD family protein